MEIRITGDNIQNVINESKDSKVKNQMKGADKQVVEISEKKNVDEENNNQNNKLNQGEKKNLTNTIEYEAVPIVNTNSKLNIIWIGIVFVESWTAFLYLKGHKRLQ